MLSTFGAMHAIAARRGDGLRSELLDLLKRARTDAEIQAKSSFSFPDHEKAGSDTQVVAGFGR